MSVLWVHVQMAVMFWDAVLHRQGMEFIAP